MYEVGKKRLDGKFNVWRETQISTHQRGWVVDSVWDDYPDALEYACVNNRKLKKKGKDPNNSVFAKVCRREDE